MNKVVKERSLYIDVMKGILITLVVIGHLNFFEYDSRTLILIYSFHMHAFLIIGGILSHVTEKTKATEILSKRIRGTLLPYFVFYLISMIFIPVESWEKRVQAIIVVFKGIGDPNYAINLPLWFLTFYFVAMTTFELLECLAYKIKVAIYGKKRINSNEKFPFVEFIVFTFIVVIMYISYWYARIYKGPRLVFNIEIAGFCLGFVFLGKILGKYVPDAFNYIKKNTALTVFSFFVTVITICILIVVWYYLSMKNGRIDLNARDYKNAFYMYFDAILAFIIFAVFSFIIASLPLIKNILAVFGENSIYILAYHVPSIIIINWLIMPLFPIEFQQYLRVNSIFSVAIITSLEILFSLIMSLIHKACHFPT